MTARVDHVICLPRGVVIRRPGLGRVKSCSVGYLIFDKEVLRSAGGNRDGDMLGEDLGVWFSSAVESKVTDSLDLDREIDLAERLGDS